jgi:hypothetical protein
MNRISIITDNISLENNNLFVLIGANRFSYFITDQAKTVLVCNTIELKKQSLNTIFEQNADLQACFSTVKIAFQNPYITLIPNLIYKEEDASTYLEKSFRIPKQHYLLTDNLPTFQCQNIYLAPTETYNYLIDKFDNVNYSHIVSSLLLKWQQKAVQLQHNSVFINITVSSFQIAVFNREKLLLWNTFEFETTKDFLYFVLLVFKQVNLNVETATVYLSGETLKDSEIHNLLYSYIRNIKFSKRTSTYEFASKFDLQPNHANFDLFSI